MKLAIFVLQLVLNIDASSAFSPSMQRGVQTQRNQVSRTRVFSQWDDEEDVVIDERKTFADAGEALTKEDDQKKMDDMGDFDANPAYKSADIDRVRDAIRQRTESLGIEKSKVSADAIQAAQERAKSGMANSGESYQQLDLSQISQESPRGEDDNTPAMFYDPENEMSEEEKIEADPDGQLSLTDQAMKEINAASWPTPGAALREVGLLIFVVVFTAGLIINWDNFLRETYTHFGLIPSAEDIMKGAENLVLPDGWTNGMSEDDFMNFQDEVGKTAASSSAPAITSGFPEL